MPRVALVFLAAGLLVACGGTTGHRSASKPALRVLATGLPPVGVVVEGEKRTVLVGLEGTPYGELSHPLRGLGTQVRYPVEDGKLLADPPHRFLLAGGAQLVRDGERWWIARGDHTFWNPPTRSTWSLSLDRTVVTASPVSRHRATMALDTRTGTIRRLPRDCHVSDTRGDRWYLACLGTGASIDSLDAKGRVRQLVPPAATYPNGSAAGGWLSAELSPDGQTLLAQWLGECETAFAFFAPASGGRPASVAGRSDWESGPESKALGWRADGRAVVSLPQGGGCSSEFKAAGVYAILPGGRPSLLYSYPSRGYFDAVLWRSLD